MRIKYSEQYEYEQISNLLGMDKKDGFSLQTTKEVTSFLPSLLVLLRLITNRSIKNSINLRSDVRLGKADDGGSASPVDL